MCFKTGSDTFRETNKLIGTSIILIQDKIDKLNPKLSFHKIITPSQRTRKYVMHVDGSNYKDHTIYPSNQFLQLEHKTLDSWLSKCVMVLHTIK